MADPKPCPHCGKPASELMRYIGGTGTADRSKLASWFRCPDPICPGHHGGLLGDWNRRAVDRLPLHGEPQDCPRCGSPATQCSDPDALVPCHWYECANTTRGDDSLGCVVGPQETSQEKAVRSWNLLGRAVDPRLALWRVRAEKLWAILDAISTLDDACRGDDAGFRRLAYQRAESRNAIAHSPDGQTLEWT